MPEALPDTEISFHNLFASMTRAVVYQDANGKIIAANQAAENILGLQRDEMIGRTSLEPRGKAIQPDGSNFNSETDPAMVALNTGKTVKDVVMGVYHPETDAYRWIKIDAVPEYREGESQPYQVYSLFEDISDNVKIETELRDAHDRLITVLNSIDATIYVADLKSYEIIFANDRMIQTYGRDVTGKICYEVFRNRTSPCPHCTNDQLVDEQGNPTGVCVWQAENPVVKKWYINYDRAIKWIDGRLVRLQIAVDITHLKKVEGKLQQAQKFEALGTLAGGIAHQFNNILGGITGYLDLLTMHYPDEDKIKKYVGRMKTGAMRMARLTTQLVAYARGGKYQAKVVTLDALIREAFPLARHVLAPRVAVDLNLPDEACHVEADPTQMQLVLSSLLVNASEAISEHGRIQVTCRNETVDKETAAERPGLAPGNYAVMTVSDDGSGMDDNTRARIFEPFFTTKFEGRGLGMAAVYGIVKGHGGWITVHSELGSGTQVDVYLPEKQATD